MRAAAALVGPIAAYSLILGLWLAPALEDPFSPRSLLVAFAVAVAAPAVLVLTIPLGALADLALRRRRTTPASYSTDPAAADIAVGMGNPASLRLHPVASFTVEALPTSSGGVVVASTTSLVRLPRGEAIALGRARLDAMRDPWSRLATHGALAWWGLRAFLPVSLLGFVLGAPSAALAAAGLLAVVVAAPRWPELLRDERADAAVIERALDREALAAVVLRLSGVGQADDGSGEPIEPSPPRSPFAPPRLAGARMTRNVALSREHQRSVSLRLVELRDVARAVPTRSDGSAPLGTSDGSVPLGSSDGSVPLGSSDGSVPLGSSEESEQETSIDVGVLVAGEAFEELEPASVPAPARPERVLTARDLRRQWSSLGGHLAVD